MKTGDSSLVGGKPGSFFGKDIASEGRSRPRRFSSRQVTRSETRRDNPAAGGPLHSGVARWGLAGDRWGIVLEQKPRL